LFTKGDKLNISNYRPLIFEGTGKSDVYYKLPEYNNNNNISAEEQYGFRTKSTTSKAIYKPTNENLKALNNKMVVAW